MQVARLSLSTAAPTASLAYHSSTGSANAAQLRHAAAQARQRVSLRDRGAPSTDCRLQQHPLALPPDGASQPSSSAHDKDSNGTVDVDEALHGVHNDDDIIDGEEDRSAFSRVRCRRNCIKDTMMLANLLFLLLAAAVFGIVVFLLSQSSEFRTMFGYARWGIALAIAMALLCVISLLGCCASWNVRSRWLRRYVITTSIMCCVELALIIAASVVSLNDIDEYLRDNFVSASFEDRQAVQAFFSCCRYDANTVTTSDNDPLTCYHFGIVTPANLITTFCAQPMHDWVLTFTRIIVILTALILLFQLIFITISVWLIREYRRKRTHHVTLQVTSTGLTIISTVSGRELTRRDAPLARAAAGSLDVETLHGSKRASSQSLAQGNRPSSVAGRLKHRLVDFLGYDERERDTTSSAVWNGQSRPERLLHKRERILIPFSSRYSMAAEKRRRQQEREQRRRRVRQERQSSEPPATTWRTRCAQAMRESRLAQWIAVRQHSRTQQVESRRRRESTQGLMMAHQAKRNKVDDEESLSVVGSLPSSSTGVSTMERVLGELGLDEMEKRVYYASRKRRMAGHAEWSELEGPRLRLSANDIDDDDVDTEEHRVRGVVVIRTALSTPTDLDAMICVGSDATDERLQAPRSKKKKHTSRSSAKRKAPPDHETHDVQRQDTVALQSQPGSTVTTSATPTVCKWHGQRPAKPVDIAVKKSRTSSQSVSTAAALGPIATATSHEQRLFRRSPSQPVASESPVATVAMLPPFPSEPSDREPHLHASAPLHLPPVSKALKHQLQKQQPRSLGSRWSRRRLSASEVDPPTNIAPPKRRNMSTPQSQSANAVTENAAALGAHLASQTGSFYRDERHEETRRAVQLEQAMQTRLRNLRTSPDATKGATASQAPPPSSHQAPLLTGANSTATPTAAAPLLVSSPRLARLQSTTCTPDRHERERQVHDWVSTTVLASASAPPLSMQQSSETPAVPKKKKSVTFLLKGAGRDRDETAVTVLPLRAEVLQQGPATPDQSQKSRLISDWLSHHE